MAKENGGEAVSDVDLFSSENLESQSSQAMGNLILTAIGCGDLIRLDRRFTSTVEKTNERLEKVIEELNGKKIAPYIQKYIGSREFLSNDQIGKMLTIGVLTAMGEWDILARFRTIWGIDTSRQDYQTSIDKVRNIYVNARAEGKSNVETRAGNWEYVEYLLNMFKVFVANNRDEAKNQALE